MAEENVTPTDGASAEAPKPAAPKPPAPAAKPSAPATKPAAAAKGPALATMTPEMTQLQGKFGEAVIAPANYVGVMVNDKSKLVEIATYLRDELGYGMLDNLTAVDYIKDNAIELVYHVQRMKGGEPLNFKLRVPRPQVNELSEPVPSLTPVYAGAEFQEREVYDLYGVPFSNHPDLRRILLWEGFGGYPMRKDWKEAYYEGDTKPFESRWPGGTHKLAEERVPWEDNVNFPPGFDPLNFAADPDAGLYDSMEAGVAGVPVVNQDRLSVQPSGVGAAVSVFDRDNNNLADVDEIKTDQIIVNMGPQHPSTHGVLRMVVKLDGETVTDLKLVLGYLHRNHEKIGERNTWLHNIPFTDRLDYLCGLANEWGYVLAVEKMMGIKPTERVEYLRVILTELNRISSHFWATGFLLNDLGAFYTPALYFITERDLIIDLFESVTGSRMMNNYMRFGGVARDLTPEQFARARELAFERIPRKIDELEELLSGNEIVRARTIGVGYLPAERSVNYSLTGPCLRAAGVPFDVRRADPYGIYDRFDFEIPVLYNADVYDRYRIRVQEMRQSVRIVQQALNQIDANSKPGDIQAGKKAYNHRVPAGQAYARVEIPKGELGFYVVSDGGQNPYRYHIRSCSFINLNALKEMTLGQKVADAVVILGSLDIVLGEVDR
jgi:NADH:ubiquinone oxidoreductase subunit D/NADH:ubiquinone oxidoreductase subunit C